MSSITKTCAIVCLGAVLTCGPMSARALQSGDDFTLQSADGPLSLSELRGKVVLVFFGFTSCADVCPISLARINAGFAKLSHDQLEQVRALFISLDPERDSLEKLEAYTGYFHENIIGLREETAALNLVTAQFGIEYERVEMPDSVLGYGISHSLDIFVIDPSGTLVTELPHNTRPDVLVTNIRELLEPRE